MITYQDLIDANEGRASLLARCILLGLVEPTGTINPDILITLAINLAEELSESEDEFAFDKKITRAFSWASRSEIAPEIGILFFSKIIEKSGNWIKSLPCNAAYTEFYEKYKDIIDAGMG